MKKKKKIIERKNITRKDLAEIFPYHQPMTLKDKELEFIISKETTQEEIGVIYSRVFNSDSNYSLKRHNQLKRIAKEYK